MAVKEGGEFDCFVARQQHAASGWKLMAISWFYKGSGYIPCPILRKRETEMPEIVIAKPREGKFNKNAARRVRVAGKIPAVLYGSGQDAVAVEVDPKQISRILFSETGHNTIFDVEVSGHPTAKAMIVDWQREPIKDKLIHIDLKRIALDKLLQVKVRVKLLGIPVGVKSEGGILDQVLREVEIECLPGDIPGHIDVDVSELTMHQVLRVSGLPHSDKVKYLTPEDATVAHVVSIREEVVATPEAAEGAVAGTAAAAGGAASSEPEVIKKGKADAAEAPAKK
jgi:large subunit ribosomal protein L25